MDTGLSQFTVTVGHIISAVANEAITPVTAFMQCSRGLGRYVQLAVLSVSSNDLSKLFTRVTDRTLQFQSNCGDAPWL